jgi:hypothetical protein
MDVCGELVFILIVDVAFADHKTNKKVIIALRLMVGFDIVASKFGHRASSDSVTYLYQILVDATCSKYSTTN